MSKWYEIAFDEKVLSILSLCGIAVGVIFAGGLTPEQMTIIVGIVSGISGLAVGVAVTKK